MDGVEQAHSTRPEVKNTGNFIGLSLETVAEITLQRTDTTHDLSSESREAISMHRSNTTSMHHSHTLHSLHHLQASLSHNTIHSHHPTSHHFIHFLLSLHTIQTTCYIHLNMTNSKITSTLLHTNNTPHTT